MLWDGEVRSLEELCVELGIRKVLHEKEFKKLDPDSTVMVVTKSMDWLQWILPQKLENSNRKTILVLEFDSFVKAEPEQQKELQEFFEKLQQRYPGKFEVELIDVRSVIKEYLAYLKTGETGVRLESKESKQQEKSADTILRLLKEYRDYNLIFYLSVDIYVDLFTKLKEGRIKEGRNNEEINNIINKIAVFVPYDEHIEAYRMVFGKAYRYLDDTDEVRGIKW